MYHEKIQTLRVTYGPMEYLPNVTPLAEEPVSDPTITQMYMQMADTGFGKDNIANNTTGAPGMSYLLQLSDGRFIMIDGGNSDGTVTPAIQTSNGTWTIGAPITTKDEQRLYDTMCRMLPSGMSKPTIAVWFISHAHGDHMLLATDFVETYKDRIKLELIAFNFLEVSQTKLAPIMKDWEMGFRTRVETNFPNAKTWIMHTGQQLFLPGCEIEVLATAEDTVCTGKTITDGNDICAVYRIMLGGTTFMVLGDAYPTTTEFMRDAYGDALESDILQLAHHGFEGSGMVADFYALVDPKICLWPCDEFRFQTDHRTIGSSNSNSTFYMNWWLRNKPWTRANRTGIRQHYTASYMTTIEASTGKKIS
jgi:glyoxylase-like metal-dependent hydrolase (beta-lactamase superfamily II)